jgi:glycogen(starch) synthase
MDISTAVLDSGFVDHLLPGESRPVYSAVARLPVRTDAEFLREVAWELGERRPGDAWVPAASHVGLAMVHPTQGFAYWRILHSWMEQIARECGGAWDGSRPVLRLYDVSLIEFNGRNAHRIQDEPLPELTGRRFFNLPAAGTWQLAEVGFLLRSGEFIPAARSPVVPFGADAPSRRGGAAGLLVAGPGRIEAIENVWDQERVLNERRRPHLRQPLRIAAFAFASRPSGQDGTLADFVTELAAGQKVHGHEVHVFVPASPALPAPREENGVLYHPLEGIPNGSPLAQAQAFANAAREALLDLPGVDLVHLHEWMTGYGAWSSDWLTVASLGSLEKTRRANGESTSLSRKIEAAERELAREADHVLTPDWLCDQAMQELGLDAARVHPFPMEGRLPNEWERPLDFGRVKMRFGIGPLDRMMIFVGPLEHAAGVDLLVEALPTLLQRAANVRMAFVGQGPLHGHLERRAHELRVAHAVGLLGHQTGSDLIQLLRSAEALVLPSRFRIAQDDAVVDLARKAARPVVTTQGGPAHLVRHEENGLVTYDNPGSMVWALDRILGDPGHADRMGQNGRRYDGGTPRWTEVARVWLESCETWFPELTVLRM